MRIFLLLASLQLGTGLFARDIVVFSKSDSVILGTDAAVAAVKDPAKAVFLAVFKADLARPAAFVGPDPLSPLPAEGREVSGAGGQIWYHRSFPGGVVLKVTLEGLIPRHKYILTLHGNPERAGNTNLVEPVPQNPRERYYDFRTITTDTNGGFHATFGVVLPAGPYDVRFYVKDTADFKIILYRDFFKFTVERIGVKRKAPVTPFRKVPA